MPTLSSIQYIVAGAQKAGSTTLLRWLSQHPQLLGQVTTEFTHLAAEDEYNSGIEGAISRHFGDRPRGRGLVIKHVDLLVSPILRQRALSLAPNAIWLIVLRDPVQRAHSLYWYARQQGWESARTFEEAIEREPVDDLRDPGLLKRAQLVPRTARWYVRGGYYVAHATGLMRDVDPDKIMWIEFNELVDSADSILRRAFELQGLDQATYRPSVTTQAHNRTYRARLPALNTFLEARFPGRQALTSFFNSRSKQTVRKWLVRINRAESDPPPMAAASAARLRDHFKTRNEGLDDLIGANFSSRWHPP